MQRIQLTRGKYAIVDDDDYDYLLQWKWHVCKHKKRVTSYAKRSERINGSVRVIMMHRDIMNATSIVQVDHVNGNGLDNRKSNLRLCTPAQNMRNRNKNRTSNGGDPSSKFKGVTRSKNSKKWIAQIMHNRKTYYLGVFLRELDAAQAYDSASVKYFGSFAKTNFRQNNA